MKIIKTKFKSVCAETGAAIPKGVNVLYEASTKKIYSLGTIVHDAFLKKEDEEREADGVRGYVEAQENAYFDNRYRG